MGAINFNAAAEEGLCNEKTVKKEALADIGKSGERISERSKKTGRLTPTGSL